jgi:integrase
VTIGRYPAIPIADQVTAGKVVTKGARSYHAEYQSLVAAGRSPALKKHADKERGGEDESTVTGFAPRFIAEVVDQQRRPEQSKRRLGRHLLPTLGNRRLEEIEAGDLLGILDALKAKGRIQEARHVLILARSFFAHAIARQRISRNPARDIPMKLIGPAGERDRALTDDELRQLLAAIARADFLNPAHVAALRLLLLTLCRKGELGAALWEHIDFGKAEWIVPASNQKSAIPHLVPLSRQAVELFRELHKLAGGSPFVLASLEGRRDKPMSTTTLNWALWQITRRRNGKPALLKIPHFTLHDFRRTASTLLHERGFAADWIEKSLGHTVKGVRGIYNRAAYAEDRRTMLQFWADYLDGLAAGNVVPLRAGKAA